MSRRAAPLFLAFLAAGLAGCTVVTGLREAIAPQSAPPPTAVGSENWKAPPKGYLSPATYPDAMAIIAPPPKPGSPEQLAEQGNFESTRALVGTPRWTQAIRDADMSGKEAFHGFSCAAGVRIGPDSTPTLAKMMLRMFDDAQPIYEPAKTRYDRRRPAAFNTAPVCVPREEWINTNGSYPSGHGMMGYAWALILTELVPDRTAALTARGREIGDSRVICGVHWPSDIEAGRLLGGALVARLHAEPAFLADMATARAEIEAARKLGAPTHCPVS
jgi:acid phosphatase (class A)